MSGDLISAAGIKERGKVDQSPRSAEELLIYMATYRIFGQHNFVLCVHGWGTIESAKNQQ